MAAKSYAGRTDLYRWLRRRHATIQEALDKHQPSWLTIAEAMIAEGVQGRAGCNPTSETVRKAWARVCRDIREEAQFRATGISKRRKSVARSGEPGSRSVGSALVPLVSANAPAPVARPQPVEPENIDIGDTKPGVAGPVSRLVTRARIAEIRLALKKL